MKETSLKVGLIKGGQLGLMLLEASRDLPIQTFVLDDDDNCPCRNICNQFVKGDALNFDDVYAFGKDLDLLTFEYEHINIEAIKQLQEEGVTVYPDPKILELVQDKGTQKEFYSVHRIPTSSYHLVESLVELKTLNLPLPFVLKTRKAGYDGKGVLKINTIQDLDNAFDEPCVAEAYIDFVKEIAVIVGRNFKGDMEVYPTVEMVFHPTKNLVEFLACPANITTEIHLKARRIATDLAEQLKMVGILAVEMFVTKDGEVLVNEIAPRVHNSGHHTIEANDTSQFAQHWKAVLGHALGSTSIVSPAVMVNILGAAGFTGGAIYHGIDEAKRLGNVYVHLYGKAITKPFRKMGHATILDGNIDKALAKAKTVKEIIQVKA